MVKINIPIVVGILATGIDLKIANNFVGSGGTPSLNTITDKYKVDAPLMCNVVYPQVLGLLDASTKEKNEVSCEYAKQCGVSWSSLKCK